MTMMKAVAAVTAGAPFQLLERPIPEPQPHEVLLKVEACGVCRGDTAAHDARHGVTLPRVPGHEVVGTIATLGSPSERFSLGQRVGVGWRGGFCRRCDACLAGNFRACRNPLTTGQNMDGGYAEYMIADGRGGGDGDPRRHGRRRRVAPLLCAGRTPFLGLEDRCRAPRRSWGSARPWHRRPRSPGDPICGTAQGCRVVALSRGKAKEALARKLGAQFYIDTADGDGAAQLKALGGASECCSARRPMPRGHRSLIPGIARNGRMVVVKFFRPSNRWRSRRSAFDRRRPRRSPAPATRRSRMRCASAPRLACGR